MTEFKKMAKRKKVKCDVCGANMLPVYGGGFDNDLFLCTDVQSCGAEIVFPTSTICENERKENAKSNDA